MPSIQLSSGEHLDSTYVIDKVDGVFGLILESWGPKDRNPDYAKAMEVILSRLINDGVPFMNVYIVSRNLRRALPKIEDRAISINGSPNIGLLNKDAHELRLTIGRDVGDLKEDSSIDLKGGNRFKRILIHIPLFSESDWTNVATSNNNVELYSPTADSEKLDRVVAALRRQEIEEPEGSAQPKQTSITTTTFLRDPLVKAWVLNNANGVCEACCEPAPFNRPDGSPYLELHHLLPLSEGGEDTPRNALAVCPNCHRRLHHGINKTSLVSEIRLKVSRLNPENGS